LCDQAPGWTVIIADSKPANGVGTPPLVLETATVTM
jgi:hypothetical protein